MKNEIIKAWAFLRENNNDIADEVLDFMEHSALEKLEEISNRNERLVIKGVSQPVLLAELKQHIINCPIGFIDDEMIVQKTTTNEDLLVWLKKLNKLSKQSL